MLRNRFLWLACVTLLAFPLSLSAQTTTGTVQGYVRDQQGAPLADAQVIARDTRNGQQTTVTSQRNGFYLLAGLTPSTYEITVRRIGSAPQARRLAVGVGQSLSLDFNLAASAVELPESTRSFHSGWIGTLHVAIACTLRAVGSRGGADRCGHCRRPFCRYKHRFGPWPALA